MEPEGLVTVIATAIVMVSGEELLREEENNEGAKPSKCLV